MTAKVWAVLQQREGKVHRMAWEAVAAAQQLAASLDGSAEAVILGSGVGALAEQVAGSDLASVRVADHALLAGYTPGGYAATLATAIRAESPDYVLFPHTYQSVEYVPRLAQMVDGALVPEAVAFETTGDGVVWRRPILTGKMQARVRARGQGPILASLQSGAFSADARKDGKAEIRSLAVELEQGVLSREVLGVEQAGGDQIDLTKAEVIVAVGRGVGGADKMAPLEELAGLLRAEMGASRPVIDAGWLPRDRQIGSSGQTVAPKLYLAFGISGAIQHLVGMKGASVIVAVNKDAGAPIFKVAHYGIVGDLHEVVPAINAALRERAS